jgi:hypothetical protein
MRFCSASISAWVGGAPAGAADACPGAAAAAAPADAAGEESFELAATFTVADGLAELLWAAVFTGAADPVTIMIPTAASVSDLLIICLTFMEVAVDGPRASCPCGRRTATTIEVAQSVQTASRRKRSDKRYVNMALMKTA